LKIGKIPVLGKGVAGVVVVGLMGKQRVALKVRREDSRRDSLIKEGTMLQLANNVMVGPKYAGSTPDLLAMELVEGDTLPLWLEKTRGRGERARVRSTVVDALRQCSRLDEANIDHGELSRAHKNILVSPDGKPWILDFESAGQSRRASNFTSLVQYLFLAGGFSRKVVRILGPVARERLLEDLRLYKTADRTGGFNRVLRTLRLETRRGAGAVDGRLVL
jgi:putative serine/threonine protein kinase